VAAKRGLAQRHSASMGRRGALTKYIQMSVMLGGENDPRHARLWSTGNPPWPLNGLTRFLIMKTLPAPLRMTLHNADRLGHLVTAEVTATATAQDGKWIWHAVFSNTGEPPAEILGSSESLEAIEKDIAARVRRLQMVDAVAVPLPDAPAPNAGAGVRSAVRTTDDDDLVDSGERLIPG